MTFTPLVQAWMASREDRTPMRYTDWSAAMERRLGERMRSPERTRATARRERAAERRRAAER